VALYYFAVLKRLFAALIVFLNVLNLLAGLGLLALGGQYALDALGLIDAPDLRWVGWFVDDLLHMGISTRSSQLVFWAMLLVGFSLVVASVHGLCRMTVDLKKGEKVV
jgi:hypothetical protein